MSRQRVLRAPKPHSFSRTGIKVWGTSPLCSITGILFIPKTPPSVMPYPSYSPQEALMVLVTPASVVALVSSLQPGKWFVPARGVCGEPAA